MDSRAGQAPSAANHQQAEIALVVAMAENRVIGRDGELPWRLPADLAHFKRLTTGHTVVMGRKTFESIGRPLPGRRNVVLTRDAQWSREDVAVAHDWDEVLAVTAGDGRVFVIGGEQVYRLALPGASTVYLTLVHATVAGDTRFPPLPSDAWRLVDQEEREADEKHAYGMTFCRYERRSGQG